MSDQGPTLGKLPLSAFGCTALPDCDNDIVEGLRSLPDLTGMISDAMDLLGLEGAVSSAELRPVLSGARVVGPAITVRNVRRSDSVAQAVAGGLSLLADIEAHNLARPGDVVVVQSVQGISSLGGIATSVAARQGEAGIVVDGYVRDTGAIIDNALPVWARGTTPLTGKWRLETVSINTEIEICGRRVAPGDIVAADDTGLCFIPLAAAGQVLAVAKAIEADEARRLKAIHDGVPIKDLPKANHIHKPAAPAATQQRAP